LKSTKVRQEFFVELGVLRVFVAKDDVTTVIKQAIRAVIFYNQWSEERGSV
jgi:hypothetical protein